MILRADGGLTVHTLVLGDFLTNAYVLVEATQPRTCWVVDPGLDVETLVDFLRRKELDVARILLTHGHGDHIAGAGAIKDAWPEAVLTAPAAEAALLSDPMHNLSALFGFRLAVPPADETVAPGDELTMGNPPCLAATRRGALRESSPRGQANGACPPDALTWRCLDTSGHTVGGLSFYCPAAAVVITGDALFAGGVGRTDLPGGDEARLRANIRANLLTLPEDTRVLPGHGPPTTIGQERDGNPYL